MWTKKPERTWLKGYIAAYHKVQVTPGQQVNTWLQATAIEFQAKFPAHSSENHEAVVDVPSPPPTFIPVTSLTLPSEVTQLVLLPRQGLKR